MELLPITVFLFLASVALNAWFTWKMLEAHRGRHHTIEDMFVDNFSALADRLEELERKHNWKGD